MVITDHLRKIFFRNSKGTTWEEKVDDFLRGYEIAKEEGKKYGMDILLGAEIAFMENNEKANDYLIYGLTREILLRYPNIFEGEEVGVKALCDREGLLFYQAHPMRGYCQLIDASLLHGVEGYNGHPRHQSHNDQIQEVAKKLGLPMIAGSDYHDPGDEDHGGILTEIRIKDNETLLDVLRKGHYQLYKGEQTT